MSIYTLESTRDTLIGSFIREAPPILTANPGDTITYRTIEASWGEQSHDPGDRIEPRDLVRDAGHALCGPVAIAGAEPGMTIGVHLGEIRPASWGWTVAGGWDHPVNRRFGLVDAEDYGIHWTIDPDQLIASSDSGHRLGLRPFMGVLGLTPDQPGILSTAPPYRTGGNLDCKELVTGSVLYLPVEVAGGLFSIGDGHAVQGDGEVSVTAIECSMDRVEVTFSLHDDMPLVAPRANTPAGWITFGLHEDLNEATYRALEGMLDLMQLQYGYSRQEALAIASLTVDLRITQIVNGVRGVHAVLPHGAIR